MYDVAITDDQQRMLCVATLSASPHGLKPSMSREEKQIIGDAHIFISLGSCRLLMKSMQFIIWKEKK